MDKKRGRGGQPKVHACPLEEGGGRGGKIGSKLVHVVVECPLINDGEKWSRIFHFEIPLASSEIPANLPGQFSLSRQIFLHWAASTLKGLEEFQNNFF